MKVIAPCYAPVVVGEQTSRLRVAAIDALSILRVPAIDVASTDCVISIVMSHDRIGGLIIAADLPGSLDGYSLSEFVLHRWPEMPILLTTECVPRSSFVGNIRLIKRPVNGLSPASLDWLARSVRRTNQ